jgi:hypothetical protein
MTLTLKLEIAVLAKILEGVWQMMQMKLESDFI